VFDLRMMNEEAIGLLYRQSLSRDFPPSELKSLSAIVEMYRRGRYDVLGAYLGDCLVGYALLYRPQEGRLALLDYFAVEPEYRHQGIGSQCLEHLRRYYTGYLDVLMVECERPKTAPDETEARRRIRFYTQAGAVLTSVRIWLFGVEYSILVFPCSGYIPSFDWAREMLTLYQQMLPAELYESNVRLLRT